MVHTINQIFPWNWPKNTSWELVFWFCIYLLGYHIYSKYVWRSIGMGILQMFHLLPNEEWKFHQWETFLCAIIMVLSAFVTYHTIIVPLIVISIVGS